MGERSASIGVKVISRKDFAKRGEEFRSLALSMEKWFITTLLVSSTVSLSFAATKMLSLDKSESLYPYLLISIWLFLLAMVTAFVGYLKTSNLILTRSLKYDAESNSQDSEIAKKELLFDAKQSLSTLPFFQKLSDEVKVIKGDDELYIRSFLDASTTASLEELEQTINVENKKIEELEVKIDKDRATTLRLLYLSIFFIAGGFIVPVVFETVTYVCSL